MMLISQYGVNQLKQNKHIIKELYFYFHNYIFFNAKERGQFHVLFIMVWDYTSFYYDIFYICHFII